MEVVATNCPGVTMSFMHPVKSRHAIARAYSEFGIRSFALDCEAELEKIRSATGNAPDLNLFLRVAVSNQGAEMPIDGKFGASPSEVPHLLQRLRPVSQKLGICFHPGSQCMDPLAWSAHCEMLSRLICEADIDVDIVDVGGGFPVAYPGKEPPAMKLFTKAISEAFARMPLADGAQLWCEPGRALVAEGTSLLTQVDLVRGNALYINDGAFGTLYDAAHCKWPYPTRLIRLNGAHSPRPKAFRLFGPTCDSADVMTGPFFLPEDIAEGDMIEIGMMGAYGVSMQTHFNGYGETIEAFSRDTPWASVFTHKPEFVLSDWFGSH
jgi:ornithine decarboxylase